MLRQPEFKVRVGCHDDFEAWFALYEAVAAEGRWIGGEAPSDRSARQDSFRSFVDDPDSESFVVEVDGSLVGGLSVRLRGGLADLGMQVDSAWRGQGVGSALMEACIAWAVEHGAHKITLSLWPHNKAALALYRKYGFEEEAHLRRHYRRRSGELWDALAMGLVLDWESPGSPYAT